MTVDDLEVEPCELCRRDEVTTWTGHGWFYAVCIDRVVQKFRAGLLPPLARGHDR